MDGDLQQLGWTMPLNPAQNTAAEPAAVCRRGWASSISNRSKVLHLPYAEGPTSPALDLQTTGR